jgi:anti-anti-sigma factor
MIRAVRDGPVSTLILCGELDACEAGGLPGQAAVIADNQTERLVLDLAGVAFLDCAGARALAQVTSLAPAGCRVIVRSLNPQVRRFLELLGLDLEGPREPSPDRGLRDERAGSAADPVSTWP